MKLAHVNSVSLNKCLKFQYLYFPYNLTPNCCLSLSKPILTLNTFYPVWKTVSKAKLNVEHTANYYKQGSGVFNLLTLTHYFGPDSALITGLPLPLSPVYFHIKTIVTVSGNSSHLNHSSFVEDRGCDECLTGDINWLEEEEGPSASEVSPSQTCFQVRGVPRFQRQRKMDLRVRLGWSLTLKRTTHRYSSWTALSLGLSIYNLDQRFWNPNSNYRSIQLINYFLVIFNLRI